MDSNSNAEIPRFQFQYQELWIQSCKLNHAGIIADLDLRKFMREHYTG